MKTHPELSILLAKLVIEQELLVAWELEICLQLSIDLVSLFRVVSSIRGVRVLSALVLREDVLLLKPFSRLPLLLVVFSLLLPIKSKHFNQIDWYDI